jgi:ABC-type antimicrobial peptide transport system permease subunit
MLRNYLLIALRNIFRYKLFSVVNLLGLAFGISSSLFIFLWVADEMSYDKFHENHERLYRVMENQHYADGQIYTFATTPAPMAPFIKDKYPEIERASRFTWSITNLFQYGTTSFYESGHYVDPEFLEMFSFRLIQGDPAMALRQKNNVVITREFAQKLFGEEDAMGKVLVVNNKDNFTVSGIIGDVPANSSIQFSYLLPFQFFWDENQSWLNSWGSNNVRTFLDLTEDADPAGFSEKLRHEVKEHNENTAIQLFIQPVDDMHLYSQFENGVVTGGRIEQVRVFSIVALFVLLIACINFMNLATAQAMRRAKEVGLRKVIGAVPGQLFRQFMGESFMTVLIASALAVLLCLLLIPVYNSVSGKELDPGIITGRIALLMGILIVITGFVAGSYPALYISRFRPVGQ